MIDATSVSPWWVQTLVFTIPFGCYSIERCVNWLLLTKERIRAINLFLIPVIYLVLVYFIGTLSGSFFATLAVVFGALGLAGLFPVIRTLARVRLGWTHKCELHFNVISSTVRRIPIELISILLSTIYLLPAIFFYGFFDRYTVPQGHYAIAQQISNGIFPPHDMAWPTHPLAYHYGADLFAAILMSIGHLRVDIAYDVVTIWGWVCFLWLLASALSQHTAVNKSLFILVVSFAGSIPWYLPGPDRFAYKLLGLYNVLNPHDPFSNVDALVALPTNALLFQPPWTIGYPAIALTFLVLQRSEAFNSAGYFCCQVLTLGVLGLANTTAFLATSGAVLGAQLGFSWRPRQLFEMRNAVGLAGTLAGIALGAAIGGLMAPLLTSSEDFGMHLITLATDGRTGDLLGNVVWNFAVFGPLLLVCVYRYNDIHLRPQAFAFLLFVAFGSILVVNLFRYTRSWDIVKFATTGIVALSLMAGLGLGRLIDGRPRKLIIGIGLAALLMTPGIAYHSVFWFGLSNLPQRPALWRADSLLGADVQDRSAIEWLRRHLKAGEGAICPDRLIRACAVLGGVPQFRATYQIFAMGGSQRSIDRLSEAMARPKGQLGFLKEAGLRWVLVDDEDSMWTEAVNAWLQGGEATYKNSFGRLQIFDIVP